MILHHPRSIIFCTEFRKACCDLCVLATCFVKQGLKEKNEKTGTTASRKSEESEYFFPGQHSGERSKRWQEPQVSLAPISARPATGEAKPRARRGQEQAAVFEGEAEPRGPTTSTDSTVWARRRSRGDGISFFTLWNGGGHRCGVGKTNDLAWLGWAHPSIGWARLG
jgi:hypothetical protein